MLSLPDKHGRTFRLLAPRKWTQESGPLLRCGPAVAELLPDLSDHATLWALVGVLLDPINHRGGVSITPNWANVSNRKGAYSADHLAVVVVEALEDM